MPVLQFSDVTFSYGREPVLEDVQLAIEEKDFVAVVGPNGGGKTTLLKLAIGLLKPNRGTVQLLDKNPEASRTHIGYTPQHHRVDFAFPVSVLDVVLMGRLNSKSRFWYTCRDKEAAMNALETMQLADLHKEPFPNLSGGQRQRTLIARAICGEPEALFLDEPTNNIDPSSESILYAILEKLNETLTILIVSHDIGVVSSIVKNVVCVNRNVVMHPTSQLTGTRLNEIYGSDLLFVRHDHRCSVQGEH